MRVFGPPLVNPVWIAIDMLLRVRGLRLGATATQQLDLAETFFDVQAAIDAAAICDQQVTAPVGTGSETQFKFRGVLQEEKPLRGWLQEVLMNCLGYYTFSFGKLKIGVRENSSTVEAFTIGNIVFNSLQLAPLKPSFDHLTANFADSTFAVKKGFFCTPGLPPRVAATIPSVCVVAALVGVANHFGYGPFTVFPQSHYNEPFMPGDRTCSGGAYTFQIPGSLAAQDNVAIPLKVQNAASIRCAYAYLQQGTSDGQSAYVVKYSTDGGATWNVLEKMGIAQSLPTTFKNT